MVAYRAGVIVGAVEFDIDDADSERRDACGCRGGEDEGERDRARGEDCADSYGRWLSEKDDAGVWKEVKPVCAELTVP